MRFVRYRYEPVKMLPYDPRYGEVFAQIQKAVESRISSCKVVHFGSTSITGMVSKPIIDIFVLADEHAAPAVMSSLRTLGFHNAYWHERSDEDGPQVLFAGIVEGGDHFNIHAHITPRDSKRYRDAVDFRDRLLNDRGLFDEYAALKMSAVSKGIPTADANNGYKDEFMTKVFENRKDHAARDGGDDTTITRY